MVALFEWIETPLQPQPCIGIIQIVLEIGDVVVDASSVLEEVGVDLEGDREGPVRNEFVSHEVLVAGAVVAAQVLVLRHVETSGRFGRLAGTGLRGIRIVSFRHPTEIFAVFAYNKVRII